MTDIRNVRDYVLSQASKNVTGQRDAEYGTPEDSFETIAELWNAYLRTNKLDAEFQITASDVAAMLALLKIARLSANPYHQDSWIDLAGYAACGGEVSKAFDKIPVEGPLYPNDTSPFYAGDEGA